MSTKGLELETSLLKALGKNLSLVQEDEWDRQGIDAVIIGQKRKPTIAFAATIALQITTARGDLEKISDFEKRTVGFQKVLYLEFLDKEISPTVIELITAIILGLNFEDLAKPRIIVRIEQGKYQRFDLTEINQAFENWLAGKENNPLVPGVLAFWEGRRENRGDQDQTESELPPANAYGFIERGLRLCDLSSGQQTFEGFVRFHVAAADMDRDLLKELEGATGDVREYDLIVLFDESARESGYKRKKARRVILKDRSDFTATQPAPQRPVEQTTSEGSLRSLLSRLVPNRR